MRYISVIFGAGKSLVSLFIFFVPDLANSLSREISWHELVCTGGWKILGTLWDSVLLSNTNHTIRSHLCGQTESLDLTAQPQELRVHALRAA